MLDFKEKMKIKKYRNSLFFVILALLIIGSSAGLSYLSMQDDHLLQSRNKSIVENRYLHNECAAVDKKQSVFRPFALWSDPEAAYSSDIGFFDVIFYPHKVRRFAGKNRSYVAVLFALRQQKAV